MIYLPNKFLRLIFITQLLILLIALTANAQTFSKDILVINSYHKGFPWTDNIVSGIEYALRPEESGIDLSIEYMDTKSIAFDEDYQKVLYNLYKYKYKNRSFDVVISSDDNSFNFLRKYGAELFPEASFLFCGVNNKNAPKIIDSSRFTGVLESTAHEQTIDLILKFHPKTQKIYLVIDTTPSGNYRWEVISPSFSRYPDIEFIRLSDEISIEEIEHIVNGLGRESAVIFFTLYLDKSGKYLSVKEAATRITRASARPVYTTHRLELPYGVVGGKVLGGFHHGEFIARMALRIINGESVSNIPVVQKSPTRYVFNYDQLKKWNISLSDLPEDSIILNQPDSLYEKNKSLVWTVLVIIILMIFFIIFLQINIFKRKHAEKLLQIRNKDFRLAQKIAKIGNWTLYPEVGASEWSDEVYKIYERDPSLGPPHLSDYKNIYKGEWLDKFTSAIQKAIQEGQPFDIELKFELPPDIVKWVQARCEPEQKNSSKGYFLRGTIQDITERKLAEIELQSNQYYLAKAQEIGHLGTWELDIPTNTLVWTDENCRIFGVPLGSIVNYEIFIDKVHPEDRDYVNQQWQAATQGKPYDIEHRIVVDGEIRWLREKADVTFDKNGLAVSAIGFAQDITDLKTAEADKLKLEKQLQQAQRIESIGHLAGGVAHDFNNMLGVILGHTELALMKADPESPFVEVLEQIHTAAKRSADLTRQLLTFASKETIAPQVLDLNQTVAGMLTMLHRLIGENIQLSWQPDPALWPVKMDPAQLDQILANLCVNARDAIEDVGTITITTQNCSLTRSELTAQPEVAPGDYVCLAVSDDGQGIDQETLAQIFEPFFSTKEFGQGTGLGLSTVYGAVKQNQGFIDVTSEPGQGTTLAIYLPRQQALPKTEQKAPAQPVHSGFETILVVEDDQMLLDLTRIMLEESGYQVLTACSIEAALSLTKGHPEPIHLLLSDIIMPEMNGKELRDKLLSIRPELKVLFMSGYPDDIIAQQGILETGAQLLQKPITLDTLTAKVREVLNEH